VPLSVNVAAPGAIASNRIADRTPVPDAPVTSAPRDSEMSMRFPFTDWVKTTGTPPERRKLPSCTLFTLSFVGSKTSVSVTVEIRDASLISSGTVYGPPPTRNVVPGGEIRTCADPIPCDVVGTASGAAGGGGGAGAGVTGGRGVGGGCVSTGAGDAVTAGGCTGGGWAGTITVPGTGDDPGGATSVEPPGPRPRGGGV
jgi:hypothetical protein